MVVDFVKEIEEEYPYVCGCSNKFKRNLLDLAKKRKGLNDKLKIIDYGSGRCDFADYVKKYFPNSIIYSVDSEKSKFFNLNKNYIDYKPFLKKNSRELNYLKGKIDIIHSGLVFHEICHDYELGEKYGGPLTKESLTILSNLYHCMKSGGYIVIEDFVKVPFRFYLKHNHNAKIFLKKYYSPILSFLEKNLINNYSELSEDDKIKSISEIVDFLMENYPKEIQSKKRFETFLKELFVDHKRFSIMQAENNMKDLFRSVRKYLDHHERTRKKDYITALKRSGFKKIKIVHDFGNRFKGLTYQFIFKKPS